MDNGRKRNDSPTISARAKYLAAGARRQSGRAGGRLLEGIKSREAARVVHHSFSHR